MVVLLSGAKGPFRAAFFPLQIFHFCTLIVNVLFWNAFKCTFNYIKNTEFPCEWSVLSYKSSCLGLSTTYMPAAKSKLNFPLRANHEKTLSLKRFNRVLWVISLCMFLTCHQVKVDYTTAHFKKKQLLFTYFYPQCELWMLWFNFNIAWAVIKYLHKCTKKLRLSDKISGWTKKSTTVELNATSCKLLNARVHLLNVWIVFAQVV